MISENKQTKTISLDASGVRDIISVLFFSLLTAAVAFIEIPLPFTPVPLTLQTLVVSLAGAFLGAKKGAVSQLLYVFYGMCGLPVFSGGALGIAHLLGPTGGYLASFPIMAFLTGILVSRNANILYNVGAFFLASLPLLLLGTLRLQSVAGLDLSTALTIGFLPFLAGDFIKCTVAAFALKARNYLMPL